MNRPVKIAATATAFLATFLVGVGAGSTTPATTSAAHTTPAPAVTVTAPATPVPAVTVTAPAPKPKVVTQVVTKNVYRVPDACVTALDYADQGFTSASKFAMASKDAFQAIQDGDVSALEAASQEMNAAGDGLHPDEYNAAKAECRANAN